MQIVYTVIILTPADDGSSWNPCKTLTVLGVTSNGWSSDELASTASDMWEGPEPAPSVSAEREDSVLVEEGCVSVPGSEVVTANDPTAEEGPAEKCPPVEAIWSSPAVDTGWDWAWDSSSCKEWVSDCEREKLVRLLCRLESATVIPATVGGFPEDISSAGIARDVNGAEDKLVSSLGLEVAVSCWGRLWGPLGKLLLRGIESGTDLKRNGQVRKHGKEKGGRERERERERERHK